MSQFGSDRLAYWEKRLVRNRAARALEPTVEAPREGAGQGRRTDIHDYILARLASYV